MQANFEISSAKHAAMPQPPEEPVELLALPTELIESVTDHLNLSNLSAFRLANSRCAATGLMRLAACTTRSRAYRGSWDVNNGGSDVIRQMHNAPASALLRRTLENLIASGSCIPSRKLIGQVHFPRFLSLTLSSVEFASAHDLIMLLGAHVETLYFLDLNRVELSCSDERLDRSTTKGWTMVFRHLKQSDKLHRLEVWYPIYHGSSRKTQYVLQTIPEKRCGSREYNNGYERFENVLEDGAMILNTIAEAHTSAAIARLLDGFDHSGHKETLKKL